MVTSELTNESLADFKAGLEKLCDLAIKRQSNLNSLPTISKHHDLIKRGVDILPKDIPDQGWGLKKSIEFLLEEVASLLNPGQAGPRYFGFITGGTLNSAILADWFTTLFDQNVQVHLPKETMSTVIEVYTIEMIIKMLGLDTLQFSGTLTTGATASNLLALICARESTIKQCIQRREGIQDWSVAEYGLAGIGALRTKVFVCQAHASIKKTSALAGIGRANVIDVGRQVQSELGDAAGRAVSLEFDLERLRRELKQCYDAKEPAIVVVGMGEVVTGSLTDQTVEVRRLCDEFQAWLHMDAGEIRTL